MDFFSAVGWWFQCRFSILAHCSTRPSLALTHKIGFYATPSHFISEIRRCGKVRRLILFSVAVLSCIIRHQWSKIWFNHYPTIIQTICCCGLPLGYIMLVILGFRPKTISLHVHYIHVRIYWFSTETSLTLAYYFVHTKVVLGHVHFNIVIRGTWIISLTWENTREQDLSFVNVSSLFHNYLPWKRTESRSPKSGSKLADWMGENDLKFCQCIFAISWLFAPWKRACLFM